MVLSNEIFVWEVGDTGKANWKIVDSTSGTATTGTLTVTLTSCSGAVSKIGLFSYGNKIYFASKNSVNNFSYSVSGHNLTASDGNYTKADSVEYEVDGGYLYEPNKNNGIVNLADDTHSIPYVVTSDSSMTIQDLFDWWSNRIYHGAISEGAASFGYETVAGNKENYDKQIKDIVYEGGQGAFAAGVRTIANKAGATAFGLETESTGVAALAAGYLTKAEGEDSVATGSMTLASGDHALAHGFNNTASGKGAVATGLNTQAIGLAAQAEGSGSIAVGKVSHAEGYETYTEGDYSLAFGRQSIAKGEHSISGGLGSEALGHANVAIGDHIKTQGKYQAGFGRWNEPGDINPSTGIPNFLFTIGDGKDEDNRHNAFIIPNTGGLWYRGTGTNEMFFFDQNTINNAIEGQQEQWWIYEVHRISEKVYDITVTNGIDYVTDTWDVDLDSPEDGVLWSCRNSNQTINMLGFDNTSDYHITKIERDADNKNKYYITVSDFNGTEYKNTWSITPDSTDLKTTWVNESSPEDQKISIDFLNFIPENVKALTPEDVISVTNDHIVTDMLHMEYTTVGGGRLRFYNSSQELKHSKRS